MAPPKRAPAMCVGVDSALSSLRIQALCTRTLGPFDLALGKGECVFLSGPSGSGKTLFLRAVADLDPHAGEVILDGRDYRSYAPPEWRRRVMLVPAESHWWEDTAGAHFPSAEPGDLQALGFEPDVLGWQVTRLSSGERQRLALLRALARSPQVLLLDEVSANLDASNALRVEALVRDYRARCGACVVWVSHDPQQIARVGGRHLRMQDGVLAQA